MFVQYSILVCRLLDTCAFTRVVPILDDIILLDQILTALSIMLVSLYSSRKHEPTLMV